MTCTDSGKGICEFCQLSHRPRIQTAQHAITNSLWKVESDRRSHIDSKISQWCYNCNMEENVQYVQICPTSSNNTALFSAKAQRKVFQLPHISGVFFRWIEIAETISVSRLPQLNHPVQWSHVRSQSCTHTLGKLTPKSLLIINTSAKKIRQLNFNDIEWVYLVL